MRKKADNPNRHERLTEARVRRFETAAEAARAHGWANATYTQHENGIRPLSRHAAEIYAAAFGVGAGWLLYGERGARGGKAPTVRFGGAIGAGHRVIPSTDLDGTTSSCIAEDDAEAFEIVGDSQIPLAWPGDTVFFGSPRPPNRLVGVECLVELVDGTRLFKTIERGSRTGLYDLTSYNATTIRDVEIVNAAPLRGVRRK